MKLLDLLNEENLREISATQVPSEGYRKIFANDKGKKLYLYFDDKEHSNFVGFCYGDSLIQVNYMDKKYGLIWRSSLSTHPQERKNYAVVGGKKLYLQDLMNEDFIEEFKKISVGIDTKIREEIIRVLEKHKK